MKRMLLFTLLLVLLVAGLTPAAQAHYNGNDAVTYNGPNHALCALDQTRYNGVFNHMKAAWHNPTYGVRIVRDGIDGNCSPEVRVSDFYCTYCIAAYYNPNHTPPGIRLNVAVFDNLPVWKRKALGAHEMGHAMGLAHSYCSQLMASAGSCSSYPYLRWPNSHDGKDYCNLWARNGWNGCYEYMKDKGQDNVWGK